MCKTFNEFEIEIIAICEAEAGDDVYQYGVMKSDTEEVSLSDKL